MKSADPIEDDKSLVQDFDTGSHKSFYDYYAKQSLSDATMQRFAGVAQSVMRMRGESADEGPLDVVDIGCGAGAQSRLWTDRKHRYLGIDINAPLIALAKQRAIADGTSARFEVASATQLPYDDASFDICLVPELLEHVQDWQSCLNEAVRVLRPGGTLYVSTSNWLCPKQAEFNLPMYSWYPGFVKRYVERRSVTDWPEVANFAKYPAVHWFSYYQLRRYLRPHGFQCADRFDVMRLDNKSALQRLIVKLVKNFPPVRLLGQMLTAGTVIVATRA